MPISARRQTQRPGPEKAGGALASLLTKLGLGGAPASGTLAGGAGYGSEGGLWALWSALTATKAGIVSLALAGTTIAAGGVYMLPALPKIADTDEVALFFPSRAKAQAQSPEPEAKPSPDGASDSLQYAREGAVQDQAVAAPSEAAAAAGPAALPDNSNHPSARAFVPPARLSGSLSALSASNSNSGGSGASASVPSGGSESLSASEGSSSGRSSRASASAASFGGASSRAGFGQTRRKALGQLASASSLSRLGQSQAQMGNLEGSSYSAQSAFGPASSRGAAGFAGGGTGLGGAGMGVGNPSLNPQTDLKKIGLPAVPPPVDVTGWKKYAKVAMTLLVVAFMAWQIARKGGPHARAAAIVGIFVSVGIAAMGQIILSFGQKWQGLIFTFLGAGFGALFALLASGVGVKHDGAQKTAEGLAAVPHGEEVGNTADSTVKVHGAISAADDGE